MAEDLTPTAGTGRAAVGETSERLMTTRGLIVCAFSARQCTLCNFMVLGDPRMDQTTIDGRQRAWNLPDLPRISPVGLSSCFPSSPAPASRGSPETPGYTTALSAGWERVRRTMPENERQGVVVPDPLAVARFLGLVEGRIRIPIPNVWEEAVKSAKGRGQRDIRFDRQYVRDKTSSSGRWLVERKGGDQLVTRGSELIKVPARDPELVMEAAVLLDGDTAIVALYSPSSRPFRLVSIDRKGKKLNWTSEVWGPCTISPPGLYQFSTGLDGHVVTIRSSDKTFAVFGCSVNGVYVELFDRMTGENRCRFGSAYFNTVKLKAD